MDFFINHFFCASAGASKRERSVFWTRATFTTEESAGLDAAGAVLHAAARAFQRAEVEAAEDPFRAGRMMAEFAEILVLPRLDNR